MIEVGTKDKVFIALVLPAALLWAFLHYVRTPAVKARDALAAEHGRLPDPMTFPIERRGLQERVAEAERALAAERALPPVETAVRGNPEATLAERQNAVFSVFSGNGVRIDSVDAAEAQEPDAAPASAGTALRAAGTRPEPAMRRFSATAGYSAFAAALGEFCADKSPVVPVCVSMTSDDGLCKWEFSLWL